MRKWIFIVFLLLSAGVFSQEQDVFDALSRLDSAIISSTEDFSPRDAYFLGRAVAAHILGQYPIYTARPALTRYLNMICTTIAINSPVPDWYNGYQVMLLDSDIFIAFSTPGGHIFLSRSLVEQAASEDMLAAVIAHELAHIQLMHSLSGIRQDRLIQELTREQRRIAIQTEMEIALFSGSVNDIVNTLFSGGYSQQQELEADLRAMALLASAGYNPGSLIEMLRILERFETNHHNSLQNTHPPPALRINALEQQSARFRAQDTRSSRQNRFNRIRTGP